MKRAFITGIAGQDGSYLAEYLLSLGYEVHGIVRRAPETLNNLKAILSRLHLHYGDLLDEMGLHAALCKAQPTEIYNLAAQVFVPTSWHNSAGTFDVNVSGLSRLIQSASTVCPDARIYQASSSEMYGNTAVSQIRAGYKRELQAEYYTALDENSPMMPVSPYGISKLAAHHLARVYREKGMYIVCGILFNHESPRRGMEMVTRKISWHVGQWCKGNMVKLKLGNLSSRRDWGYAGDYVRAMHVMLQQDKPQDFVIGTGEAHSVGEFLHYAVQAANDQWLQKGAKPPLFDLDNLVVANNPVYTRQNELHCLVADSQLAHRVLNWEPSVDFYGLVKMMVAHDAAQEEAHETRRDFDFVQR